MPQLYLLIRQRAEAEVYRLFLSKGYSDVALFDLHDSIKSVFLGDKILCMYSDKMLKEYSFLNPFKKKQLIYSGRTHLVYRRH